jgi:hypothetical protein
MAWAAGSLWLITISRDGLRNILTVGFGALALAALLRWGDRPSRRWAVITGAAAGAGLWTYQPLKLLPLLVLAWLLWMRHAERDRCLRVRARLGWAVLAYVVVAAPMLWTAITDAASYFGRAAGVSALNLGATGQDGFVLHVLKTVGMFLVTGDPNARHDVDALPLLGPLLFITFALGVWRAWRHRHEHGHALLLLGLVVFLLPPLLATEGGAPHFLRSLGLAPFVAALIGLGCVELVRLAQLAARRMVPEMQRVAVPAAVGIVAIALSLLGLASVNTYLNRPVTARYDAYSFADVQLAAAADHGPGTVAVINDYDAYDVRFLDAANPPTIVSPSQHLSNPRVYSLLVASSRADIAAATDAATAARASVAGVDVRGQPVVWEVVP